MKLLSLYINNFGKISDFSYDFNDELNEIVKDNGWGKTTIAAFIKAMLFGLSEKGKSIDNNSRLKYAPWQGGIFGGSLKIEVNNRRYNIVRTFASKGTTKDTFELYDLDTNKISNDFGENIGEEIFGINAFSYERSIYVPQKELNDGFGKDLTSKLINLVNATDDTQNFEIAVDKIKKRYKEIKMNANKGLLIDAQKRLYEIELKIREVNNNRLNLANLSNDISRLEEQVASFERELKNLDLQIEAFGEIQERKANVKIAHSIKNQIDKLSEEIDLCNQKLGVQDIDEVELTKIEKTCFEYEKEKFQLQEERQKLVGYTKKRTLTELELNEIKHRIEGYYQPRKAVQKIPTWFFITIGLSLLSLMSGIALIFFYLIPGIILIVISLMMVMFSFFEFMITKNDNSISHGEEEYLRKVFAEFEIYTSDYHKAYYELKMLNDKLINENNDYEKRQKLINDLEAIIQEKEHLLQRYFDHYELEGDNFIDKLDFLKKLHFLRSSKIKDMLAKEKEYGAFLSANPNLFDEDFEVAPNLEVIGEKKQAILLEIKNINAKKGFLLKEREVLQEQIDHLGYYEEEKEKIVLEINEMKKEYSLLKKTEEFLILSNDSLAQKFVKPMKEAIYHNLQLFGDTKIKEFNIGLEYDFMFYEKGKNHELGYLSKGYQTLVMLCMRIALIDCLFTNEKPMIVLDDSFVHFDQEKLKLAKQFLINLSKKYQVLYLTCHESRKVN